MAVTKVYLAKTIFLKEHKLSILGKQDVSLKRAVEGTEIEWKNYKDRKIRKTIPVSIGETFELIKSLL